MRTEIFIQSNKKQILGAKLAKYAMETSGGASRLQVPVSIMEVETYAQFQAHEGKPYRAGYAPFSLSGDLQSFTMTRFLPPELMNYEGRAIVIDPDIFALSDISALLSLDLGEAAIAACRKKDAWDSSVMVLDASKLKHWKVEKMLQDIATGVQSYEDFSQLRKERTTIMELPRIWNSLDLLTPETKMLHTTMRLTQPWKTGLPIDFTQYALPKYFGIIPQEPIQKLLGKYPTHYKRHPDRRIEDLFFTLLGKALEDGVITTSEVEEEMQKKHIRSDALKVLSATRS